MTTNDEHPSPLNLADAVPFLEEELANDPGSRTSADVDAGVGYASLRRKRAENPRECFKVGEGNMHDVHSPCVKKETQTRARISVG